MAAEEIRSHFDYLIQLCRKRTTTTSNSLDLFRSRIENDIDPEIVKYVLNFDDGALLMEAAWEGRDDIIRELLVGVGREKGFDQFFGHAEEEELFCAFKSTGTALHVAIRNDKVSSIRELLGGAGKEIGIHRKLANLRPKADGISPILAAVAEGDEDCLCELMLASGKEAGLDVNAVDLEDDEGNDGGKSLLHHAIYGSNNVRVVELLLGPVGKMAGFRMTNALNARGLTALHEVILKRDMIPRRLELIEKMLTTGGRNHINNDNNNNNSSPAAAAGGGGGGGKRVCLSTSSSSSSLLMTNELDPNVQSKRAFQVVERIW